MYKGSCLCGSVTYEVQGELGPAVYCHCSRCRKAGGSAFASNAALSEGQFKVIQGEGVIKTYSTAEGVHRWFCSTCGSPIVSKLDSFPGMLRLRLGTLDTPLSVSPKEHIFVGSKADWYEIYDSLPQHTERAGS